MALQLPDPARQTRGIAAHSIRAVDPEQLGHTHSARPLKFNDIHT